MKTLLSAILCAGALAGTGWAQPPAEGAGRGLAEALASSPAMAAARAARAEARAQAEQIRIGDYETSLNAGLLRRDTDLDGQFSEWQMGVSRRFRWPEKSRVDAELARTQQALAEAGFDQAWQASALDWAALWVAWHGAQTHLDIRTNQLADARERRDAEVRRIELGRGRAVDLDRFERDLSLARAAFAEAEQMADLARLELEALYPGTASSALGETLAERVCAGLPEDADPVETALQASPALRAARLNLEMAQLQARRAELDRQSDVELGVQVFSERDGAETGLGVSVSVPITGGLRAARLEEAAGRRDGRLASLAAQEADIRRIALQQEARLVRSQIRLEQAEAAVAASRRVLDRLEQGQALAAVTTLDLLEARSALWSARAIANEARIAHLDAVLSRGIRLGCLSALEG